MNFPESENSEIECPYHNFKVFRILASPIEAPEDRQTNPMSARFRKKQNLLPKRCRALESHDFRNSPGPQG